MRGLSTDGRHRLLGGRKCLPACETVPEGPTKPLQCWGLSLPMQEMKDPWTGQWVSKQRARWFPRPNLQKAHEILWCPSQYSQARWPHSDSAQTPSYGTRAMAFLTGTLPNPVLENSSPQPSLRNAHSFLGAKFPHVIDLHRLVVFLANFCKPLQDFSGFSTHIPPPSKIIFNSVIDGLLWLFQNG